MTSSFPAGIEIRSSRFGLKTNTQLYTSPLSGDTQRAELPGARWFATYTLVPKKRADIAAIQAFLANLAGPAGSFYGYDPNATNPRGAGGGTPLVNGASQTGSSLITDGWPNSTAVLKAGDYFTVNGEYKMITADVTSDGSGNATLSFAPALRSSPADNDPITITNPTCIMRLVDDDQAAWDISEAGFYDVTFNAIETFFA
jgi:hypothetical protein